MYKIAGLPKEKQWLDREKIRRKVRTEVRKKIAEVKQLRMLSLGSTGPRLSGVKNEGKVFYAAFLILSKNLVFKKVVPAQMPRNPKRATYLSRKLVQPLR